MNRFPVRIAAILFCIAINISTGYSQQTPEAPAPKAPGKLLDIGGYKLHLHVTGKGNPAVVRILEEKRKQKIDFATLSNNSKVIYAQSSGHRIHLDQPELAVDAIRQIVEAVRRHARLSPN